MFGGVIPIPTGPFHYKIYNDITFNVPTRYIFLQERVLASGIEGVVIMAHDRATCKNVVIKKIKKPFSPDNMARRAHREFVLSQIVNHKNVVQLLSAFSPNEGYESFAEIYFVTEFIPYTLAQLIQNKHKQVFSSGEIISYLTYQILCGIKHLHKAGITHRDLSPNNIMVNKNSQLKIIDLGLARQIPENPHTLTGYVQKRFYRAPEVVLDLMYDRKVDIWSVGCILAEMLRGDPLFPGENQFDQWAKIIEVLGSPTDHFKSRLPPPVLQFVEKYPYHNPKSWPEIFPNVVFPPNNKKPNEFPKCTASFGCDLLSSMLIIDPAYRISVDEALNHPYVMWQNEPGEIDTDTNPYRRYNGYIDNLKFTENEWKACIFAELKQYERDIDIFGTMEEKQKSKEKCDICRRQCQCEVCSGRNLNIGTP